MAKATNLHRVTNALIISDTQAPFHHPDALAFLEAAAIWVSPEVVIHVGDEIDNHTLARNYRPHPNAPSAGDEFSLAAKFLDDLEKIFPRLLLCESNHAARLWKTVYDAGVPDQWVRTPKEAYNKSNWTWAPEHWIETDLGPLCVNHGDRQKGALRYAKTLGASVAQGHHHSEFGIHYMNGRHRTIFGMDVGCLCDEKSLALAYAKTNPVGQVLGCGAIVDGWPRLMPMETDLHGRWTGRLI